MRSLASWSWVDRTYDREETEWLVAIDRRQRDLRVMRLSDRQVLALARDLGYRVVSRPKVG